jgi:Transposase DDE domain/Transposase domain (DUF772)
LEASLLANVLYKQFNEPSFGDFEVYSVLPEHPIWSQAEKLLDFNFADQICAPLYFSRGARPYAPSLKLKIHIIQRYYNLSDREMEERVIGDLFIKRFLGLPVRFMGFDHSTLGLDRDRLGSDLFDACHHHILAQAKKQGLWGDNKDVWLVDSFHTDGHVVKLSGYRLIKQAILRLLNHLKRAHRVLFRQLEKECDFQPLTAKLPSDSTPADIQMFFSQLVVLAYHLLHWFESAVIRPLFWSWSDAKRQLTSLELQALLYRILTENVQPEDPTDTNTPYKKLDRKDRPKDRILSAADPDVRTGAKTKTLIFTGDKVQVVTSARNGLVLNAEPIAGNESDGERLLELVNQVRQCHQINPVAIIADSAYGFGRNRRGLANENLLLVAPLKNVAENVTGLFSNIHFQYDAEKKSVTCPKGITTQKASPIKTHDKEGVQYKFEKAICDECPLKEQCTTNKTVGRTIYISEFYEEFQEARAFNEKKEGKDLLLARSAIERKNHEMKNHNGLGLARLRTREKRRVDVKIVSIVVNLKQVVKQYGSITLGFVRKKPSLLQGTFLPIMQN